jgi:hypothetical protein
MRQTLRSGTPVRRGMHPAPEDMRSALDNSSEKAESEHDLRSERAMSRDTEARPQVPETKRADSQDDDPFGNEDNNEVKYRTLRWW